LIGVERGEVVFRFEIESRFLLFVLKTYSHLNGGKKHVYVWGGYCKAQMCHVFVLFGQEK
jgi:hypothetical protein